MNRSRSRSLVATTLIFCLLFVSGCAMNKIPPAGTSVTSTSPIFRQTASGLADHCAQIGGCTCILDGIQTTCAVVFACLDAGFCRVVAR